VGRVSLFKNSGIFGPAVLALFFPGPPPLPAANIRLPLPPPGPQAPPAPSSGPLAHVVAHATGAVLYTRGGVLGGPARLRRGLGSTGLSMAGWGFPAVYGLPGRASTSTPASLAVAVRAGAPGRCRRPRNSAATRTRPPGRTQARTATQLLDGKHCAIRAKEEFNADHQPHRPSDRLRSTPGTRSRLVSKTVSDKRLPGARSA